MAEEELTKTSSIPEGLAKSKDELIEKLKHAVIDSKEDKPKIRNHCGDCAAFHTHFCPFELTDQDRPRIYQGDVACYDFFPRLKAPKARRPSFNEAVSNL
jgi:hypothetical protein